MRRSLLLLAACLLLLTRLAQAQLLWQQATGTSQADETSTAFLPVPGGYLQVGKSSGNTSNNVYRAKLTAAGAVVWQKASSFANRNVAGMEVAGAAADASGQFYTMGQCTELVPRHTGQLYYFGLLAKYTAAGDTLWTRVLYGTTQTSQAAYSKAVVTASGELVVIGNVDDEHFIAKFSAAGQELWHRSYITGNRNAGYFSNITSLAGGSFLVAQSQNYLTGQPARYLVLDSQGLLLSTHPARSYTGHYSLTPDAAGNVLDAAGLYLYKLSPQGDTLWSRRYVQYGTKVVLYQAVPVPGSNNYLLAGTRSNTVDDDLSLLLVDNNGTKLRDTVLVRYGGNERPGGLSFDALGNYVVGLWTSDNGPIGLADQVAFCLRNWNRLLPTRASQAAAAGLTYSAYPNPAGPAERVRVAVAGAVYAGAYELRELTGRLVQAGERLPPAGLPVAELPPGLYLLRVQAQGVWLPALRVQVLA